MYGAIMFFFAEVINGQPNVPVDVDRTFSFHYLLYYWFAFGANLIWIVIPTALIIYGWRGNAALVSGGEIKRKRN
jgi:hypothetical protein